MDEVFMVEFQAAAHVREKDLVVGGEERGKSNLRPLKSYHSLFFSTKAYSST